MIKLPFFFFFYFIHSKALSQKKTKKFDPRPLKNTSHSHIVFDVDDGPKTIEDGRALLEEAYAQGVRTVVSTSHRRKGMFSSVS